MTTADSTLLEKMGRELKCPICMSLLDAAVSLVCNHVFCKACISKSMKSSSNCPVCKVPYQRREVRPAPHMDNMVNIYRNMEIASGISIFVTQPESQNKEDGQIHNVQASNGTRARKHKKDKNLRRVSQDSQRTNHELTNSQTSEQLSFPAKKRVHVPLNPPFDIPVQSVEAPTLEKLEKRASYVAGNKDSSNILKEKPSFDDKGNPIFCPFFWLREENESDEVENLSGQLSENDFPINSHPRVMPSFSDIKESDDDVPIRMSPTVELDSKPKTADVYESEMFDWTQRPCSPELFSTPMKRKEKHKGIALGEDTKASDDIHEQQASKQKVEFSTFLLEENGKCNAGERRKFVKSQRAANLVQTKHIKKFANNEGIIADDIHEQQASKQKDFMETVNGSKDVAENSIRKTMVTVKTRKGRKRKCIEYSAGSESKFIKMIQDQIGQRSHNTFTGSPDRISTAKDQSHVTESDGIGFSILQCQDVKTGNAEKLKFREIKTGRADTKSRRTRCELTTQEDDEEKVMCHDEHTKTENMDNELIAYPGCRFNQEKALVLKGKTNTASQILDTMFGQKGDLEVKEQKQAKNGQSALAIATKSGISAGQIDGAENKIIPKANKNSEVNNTVNKPLLKKCKSMNCQARCAFCNSCDVSELYGEMVHYLEGKPVSYDHNKGKNLVHSHRNCTEWAPNVYFKEDIAINLQSEILRSRRITCSCCAMKGAALGCYHKNCRKSFHVPCARMVPQCRWDKDNFVMLCPLHSDLKLPKETPNPSEKSQNKPKSKKTQAQLSSLWKWPSGSAKKWVLCCSGLTAEEKESVYKFSKLAGVSVAKSWNSAVTHVIASTNENGACKRTLKFFMAILEGIWIVKIDWIMACLTSMEPVAEENYEITADVHGISGGPQEGRMRIMSKEPRLFKGLKFYFIGEFMPSYKGFLHDLVLAGGGTIMQRKPISGERGILNEPFGTTTYIIYSAELPDKCNSCKASVILKQRKEDAKNLAGATKAKVAAHSWILDSIAACKLQNVD